MADDPWRVALYPFDGGNCGFHIACNSSIVEQGMVLGGIEDALHHMLSFGHPIESQIKALWGLHCSHKPFVPYPDKPIHDPAPWWALDIINRLTRLEKIMSDSQAAADAATASILASDTELKADFATVISGQAAQAQKIVDLTAALAAAQAAGNPVDFTALTAAAGTLKADADAFHAQLTAPPADAPPAA